MKVNDFHYIIDKNIKNAKLNMAYDEALLINKIQSKIPPIIRFYKWEKNCFSFGYSQKISNNPKILNNKSKSVRRLTGGGIVNHNNDVSYCLISNANLMPKGIINSFNKIHYAIYKALLNLGLPVKLNESLKPSIKGTYYCFKNPVKNDIFLNNKKIVGSAQKRFKNILMQEGSIFIDKNISIEKLAEYIIKALEIALNVSFLHRDFDAIEVKYASDLYKSKYTTDTWNFKN